MHRSPWRPRRGSLVALALLVLVRLSGLAWAGEAVPSRPELQQLLDSADALLQQVSQARGIPVQGPLAKAIRSKAEITAYIKEQLHRRYPPNRILAEQKALLAFRLVPPDFQLEPFYVAVLTEQVAGYYDPVRKEILFADWLPAPVQQVALLHELTHVLQDQRIDLDKYLGPALGATDALAARQAIIEGEAQALMIEMVARGQGVDVGKAPDLLSAVTQLLSTQTSPVLSTAPKFLRDSLIFPYVAGTAFVQEFRKRHPWPEFNRVHADPPRSTAQILHPERYLSVRHDPIPLALPRQEKRLGPGWTLVQEDVAGELGLRGALEVFLGEAEAAQVAEGWAGDRYQVYEEGGGYGIVLLTAWDTPAKASAFADAYGRLAERKYPELAGKGKGARDRREWPRWPLGVSIEVRGTHTLVLENVPVPALGPMAGAIWRDLNIR